ncbi:ricin-type beta-trefoil lectin domain protein [Streptomyces sp. MUM 2J]|uniref:ricin-type beta-trefoil lectin domain protein n=1 Tax=Streptomyces sp. MUM 2J TaxID=2791987 RepID=UPI001F0411BF|nr:ricin-type beta-trefoil lectin domain protein [Streptomyces sp. MUM 2J]MCH0566228.1 ricin-type beta-trefoil lectin domain protein [Streptomyces sp. MUM 2J]
MLQRKVQRWWIRLLTLALPVGLLVAGVSLVQLRAAPHASAAPVTTTPPDLSHGARDSRARRIYVPQIGRAAQLLTYEYRLPGGQSAGIAVYPGVLLTNGSVTKSVPNWPPAEVRGQAAQDFLNRTWAELDEIASNPEGVRALRAMGEASPLPASGGTAAYQFHDVGSSAPSDVKTVITHAPQGDDYQAVKLGAPYSEVAASGTWTGEGQGTGVTFIEVPDHIHGALTAEGANFGTRPATALFHELIHALRGLLGFVPATVPATAGGSPGRVSVTYPVDDFTDPSSMFMMTTNAEELITHGGRAGLKAAFGAKWYTAWLSINADPYAAKSVGIAATAVKAAPRNAAVARTLKVRKAIADRPVSELSFVDASSIAQPSRPAYNAPPNATRYRFAPASGKTWRALTQDDYEDPLQSSSLTKTEYRAGTWVATCPAGNPVFGCYDSSRAATSEEIKEAQDFQAADAASKVVEESPEGLIVRGMPAEDLPVYAQTMVAEAESAYRSAAPSDLAKVGFTSNLRDSWRNRAKVFVPLGGATSASGKASGILSPKLTEAFSDLNTAATPAMVLLWINSMQQAFSADSSDLDKATATLALVPVVGQLLGIADSAIHQDPAGITANVLTLLAIAADFAAMPEVSLVLGVAALITAVVQTIISAVQGVSEVGQMISSRDKAWHDELDATITGQSIPALLANAQAAFRAAQNQVLWSANLSMAMLDAKADASGSSAVMTAAQTAKARIVADTTAAEQALRSGFIKGVHQAIGATVDSLNRGTGSDVYTASYLERSYDSWYNAHFNEYCSGSSCSVKQVSARMRAHYDSVVAPQVKADVPKNKFSSDDLSAYQDAVDSQITSKALFRLVPAVDTAPVAPIHFINCADQNGTCKSSVAATGQVVFGAAGSYVTRPLPSDGVACEASSFVTDPNPSAHETCFVQAPVGPSTADDGSWLAVVAPCGDEGDTCTVSGTQEVAYGTGATWIIKPVTSSITCSAGSFGADPAPGASKRCTILAGSVPGPSLQSGGPAGFCAAKGGVCYVSGKTTLAYGAQDNGSYWVYRSVNGADYPHGVPCTAGSTDSTFPTDPLPGHSNESCHLARPPAHLAFCAGPGGTCTVPSDGVHQMAYGGNGAWVVKTVGAGSVACEDAAFSDVTRLSSTALADNTHNYCYLSVKNGDLVIGDTGYDFGNQGYNWYSIGCRSGETCSVTSSSPTETAYGTYNGLNGTYLVKQVTTGSDQTARLCSHTTFTASDPQLGIAYCFALASPTTTFNPAQTGFIYPTVPALVHADITNARLVNTATGQCLDVHRGQNVIEGSAAGLSNCAASTLLRWSLTSTGSLEETTRGVTQCLGSNGYSMVIGSDCYQNDPWWWQQGPGFSLINQGQCLTALTQYKSPAVKLALCNGSREQEWRPMP